MMLCLHIHQPNGIMNVNSCSAVLTLKCIGIFYINVYYTIICRKQLLCCYAHTYILCTLWLVREPFFTLIQDATFFCAWIGLDEEATGPDLVDVKWENAV